MVHKVVAPILLFSKNAYAMILARNIKHVEVLVGLHKSVYNLKRRRRINVAVHLADND